jgi:hypothetical protein
MELISEWWTSANAWLSKPLTRGDLLVAGILVFGPIWQMLTGISRQLAAVARMIRPDIFE